MTQLVVPGIQFQPYFEGSNFTLLSTVWNFQRHNQFAGCQRDEAANATINRELALLKRALNLGRKHTPPKILRVPYIPMLDENNVRKGFFEHDQYLKLKAALPQELRPVLVFAYYTGCRRGEIFALLWPQIDLTERVIRQDPGTTKNEEHA